MKSEALARGFYRRRALPVIVAMLVLGVVPSCTGFRDQQEADAVRDFTLLRRRLLDHYIDPIESDELLHRALSAMVEDLDRWTTFISPVVSNALDADLDGKRSGIGAALENKNDAVVVLFPFPGSPAATAGLKPGDEIVSIDGQPVHDIPLRERNQRLLGPPRTHVNVSFRRGDADLDSRSIARSEYHLPSVKWQRILRKNVGYVHISAFTADLIEEFDDALSALSDAGAKALIIDLRFNGGGLARSATILANRFIREGRLSITRYRGREDSIVNADRNEATYAGLPLVILVNERSASASEKFAAAIRDHGAGVLVGVKTTGKGTTLNSYELKSTGATVYYSVGRWHTPKGVCIEGEGLIPDFPVELPLALRAELYLALSSVATPDTLGARGPEGPLEETLDPQLACALDRACSALEESPRAPNDQDSER